MDFCFCTLALGSKYRLLTKELIGDLEKYAPEALLVIYTDEPEDFSSHRNVLAFKHRQKGIVYCYDDKRFVLEKALSLYPVAVFLDADSRIIAKVPDDIKWQPGITAPHDDLLSHMTKWTPQQVKWVKDVASKLDIPLENASWVSESLYIVARDEGREIEFIKQWGIIARHLEIKGYTAQDGNCMGLAAAKVGWTVKFDGWENLHKVTKHLDGAKPRTFWNKLQEKLNYYYRLNLARLNTLKEPI